MIIAFWDLLVFSWLVKNNITAAYDNLNTFNQMIRTKITDEKTHPASLYNTENGLKEFAQNASLSSFNNMINISDSLIIGAEEKDADLFVRQLSTFVATAFMEYAEPFNKPFTDLSVVENSKICDVVSHMAFPMLFRGGVSVGDGVFFKGVGQIYKGQYCDDGLDTDLIYSAIENKLNGLEGWNIIIDKDTWTI